MKPATALAALPLLAAVSVTAVGIVDNSAVFNRLATSAHEPSGQYKIQNVATGKYLYFERPDDTTNLITGNDDSRTVELGQDSAYGQSGRKYDTWSGTFIRGLEKCMSAQWGDGIDHAAVSYACKVGGSTDGTDTLEVAKQFWKFVPCGSSSEADDDHDDDKVSVQFNADESSGSHAASNAQFTKASDDDSGSATATTKAPAATQSVDSKDRSTWVCRHPGWWLARHPDYITEAGHIECKDELAAYRASDGGVEVAVQFNAEESTGSDAASNARFTKASDDDSGSATVDSKDRSTWVCRHPGWWLARHPEYVTEAGHIECKDELAAFRTSQRRMIRRSRLPHGAALAARQKRAERTYCIIAVDHLTDMTTRALTPNHVETVGGYSSLKLADWDKTDPEQQWRLISA
ncbi:hypothetical protein JCM3770_002428 [Rhodotorula araucariae]